MITADKSDKHAATELLSFKNFIYKERCGVFSK